MSQEVLEGQRWLNSTYGDKAGYCHVEETGLPGSATSAALVSALQIELKMDMVTGVFGEMTESAFVSICIGDSGNQVKIIQYGLLSKGYDPGAVTGIYNGATGLAVQEIIGDAGIQESASPVIGSMYAKAILGVDEYKIVGNGDTKIRGLQQDLNRRYLDYTGLRACDGHYGRSTNEAIIFAIQAEEGMSTSMATGYFGQQTKAYLPDLWQSGQYGMNGVYTDAQIERFTILAKYALYCNGRSPYKDWDGDGSDLDPGVLDGLIANETYIALNDFQAAVGLPQRDMIGLNEWMALLVSTGNPNRDALACDCATQLTTPELASSIYNEDYRVVGRYLTGSVGSGDSKRDKFLTREEAEMMFGLGLNAFCIFQDDLDWWQAGHDDLSDYFGYARGYVDANKAVDAAQELGVPDGEYIYFAVDYDFMEDEVYSKIIPHFSGINDCMSNRGNPYNVGIYSARNTCGIVSAQGLATSSFVSDMSTGYSGNLGYPLPSNWAFDQIKEYTNPAGVPIDKDVTSGRYMGFNTLQGPLMSTVEKGATVNYVDNNYDVEASSYMALERYTTNQEGRFRYALATESLCNVLDPGELFRGIRGVKIEIEAYDGAYFDLSVEGAGSTGCFPEVEKKTILEKRVEEEIVKQVIGLVLSAVEIRGKAVRFGIKSLATLLMGLNEAMSASLNSSTKLIREFRWDTLQDQTNQAMVFYPVFPTQGGYFEVTYTVECGSVSGGSTKTLVNTLTISNPR